MTRQDSLSDVMNQLYVDVCISCNDRDCLRDSKYCWVCENHLPPCSYCGDFLKNDSMCCESCWDKMSRMETHQCCFCETECNAHSQCCGQCARKLPF